MQSKRWRPAAVVLAVVAIVTIVTIVAMRPWRRAPPQEPGPEGYYKQLVANTAAKYGFRATDFDLMKEYKRSLDAAPRSKEKSLNAFRLQKGVFDYMLISLESGREDALSALEASFGLPVTMGETPKPPAQPASGPGNMRARVHAVALGAEPYFSAIARETDDEETHRFIDIGIGMYKDLARWTDPSDHRFHEPILRQASCTDLSWAGGSRYLLAQAIRETLLDAPADDANAAEALLKLRLGPVLGMECPIKTGMLKAAVALGRTTAADLARSGISTQEGGDPPAVLLALHLLTSIRDWTIRGLDDHPLRDVFAAFDRRLAEDLGAHRFALPDGRTARLGGKGAIVE
jgi:hypothetical protein